MVMSTEYATLKRQHINVTKWEIFCMFPITTIQAYMLGQVFAKILDILQPIIQLDIFTSTS